MRMHGLVVHGAGLGISVIFYHSEGVLVDGLL